MDSRHFGPLLVEQDVVDFLSRETHSSRDPRAQGIGRLFARWQAALLPPFAVNEHARLRLNCYVAELQPGNA
jgi:hypothetical protein